MEGRLKRTKIRTYTKSTVELLNQPRDIAQSNLNMRWEVCSVFSRKNWSLFVCRSLCDSKGPQLQHHDGRNIDYLHKCSRPEFRAWLHHLSLISSVNRLFGKQNQGHRNGPLPFCGKFSVLLLTKLLVF